MTKGRLEAFSDGVIAIIITIMVLNLKPPEEASLEALRPLLPPLGSYILSFVYVGIYWNNHHHLLQAASRVSGGTLWANLHLLFWLSLTPFVTSWVGSSHFASWPVAIYGIVFFMAAVAWNILRANLISSHDESSSIRRALSSSAKEWISTILYALAIGLAFIQPYVSAALYALVAIIWFVPDRRIERVMGRS